MLQRWSGRGEGVWTGEGVRGRGQKIYLVEGPPVRAVVGILDGQAHSRPRGVARLQRNSEARPAACTPAHVKGSLPKQTTPQARRAELHRMPPPPRTTTTTAASTLALSSGRSTGAPGTRAQSERFCHHHHSHHHHHIPPHSKGFADQPGSGSGKAPVKRWEGHRQAGGALRTSAAPAPRQPPSCAPARAPRRTSQPWRGGDRCGRPPPANAALTRRPLLTSWRAPRARPWWAGPRTPAQHV